MNNKCEWKDGKFEGCRSMEYRMKNHGWVFTVLAKRLTMYYNNNGFWFCPFCGADIREPEEKPLIVKSGGTFVAHFESVDYLILNPNWWVAETSLTLGREIKKFEDEIKAGRWIKPFSEITLDDEIAKLRPMVVTEVLPGNCSSKLISVENATNVCGREISGTFYNCVYANNIYTACETRLATPHELQEAESAK